MNTHLSPGLGCTDIDLHCNAFQPCSLALTKSLQICLTWSQLMQEHHVKTPSQCFSVYDLRKYKA